MNNKTSSQMIDKDELTGAAVLLDSTLCLMQDLTEDYFVKYDYQSEDGRFGIVLDYNRYRSYAQAIYELVFQMQKIFDKNEITAYSALNKTADTSPTANGN